MTRRQLSARLRRWAVAVAVVSAAGPLAAGAQFASASSRSAAATTPAPSPGSKDPLYDHSQYRYMDPLRLPQAWQRTTGSPDVTVAIVDSGVDLGNAELKPNLRPGRDIVGNDDFPMDDSGHGTTLAGIVAAPGDDGIGAAGVAWHVGIMPVKVLDRATGTDANIGAGITWAADHGADVILLTLAGQPVGAAVRAALDHARDKDVVVVAAAGDRGVDTPSYPAAYDDVLAVTATDLSGHFSWESNWGPWVDLAAPGFDVASVADTNFGTYPISPFVEGTEPAAALVAGVAALARSARPQDAAPTIRARLESAARDAGPHGFDPQYGWGIIDALGAVGGPAPAPHVAWARDDHEPNDTADSAAQITGDSLTATLAPEGDVDWFAVPVTTPQWLHLTVTGGLGGWGDPGNPRAEVADPVVDVYDSSLHRLTTADRVGPGQPESLWVHGSPGQLLVSVHSRRGAAGAAYDVRVERADAPPMPFADPEAHGTEGEFAEAVAIADVTGDGRNDVIASTSHDYGAFDGLFVFPGRGDGELDPPATYRLDVGPRGTNFLGAGVTAGDLDGDGRADVALAAPMGINVYLQRSGKLAAPTTYGADRFYNQVAIGDFDGDGRNDIVGIWTNQGVDVFRNTGSGFAEEHAYAGNIRFPVLGVGDLTGDGRADVAFFDCGCLSVSVLSRQADGTWARQSYSDPEHTPQTAPIGLAVTDISGDGRADLVALGNHDVFSWMQGPGGLGPELYQELGPSVGGAMQLVDVTGDGRRDLVLSGLRITVLAGLPGGGFAAPVPSANGGSIPDNAESLAVGDVDGDGLPDAVQSGGTAGVYVNRHYNVAPPARESLWLRSAIPQPFSEGAPGAVVPAARFARALDPASVSVAVHLVDDETLARVPATVSYDATAQTVTVRPRAFLADGPYSVEIGTDLRDADGQHPSAPIGWRFTVGLFPDHDPPDTVITSGPDRPYDSRPSATFAFASDDPAARFECAFDQDRFVPCSSPYTVSGLEPWMHWLRVRAVDPADNADATPAEYGWQATPPPDPSPSVPPAGPGSGGGSPSSPGSVAGAGAGYWLLGGDGHVYAFGAAGLHGDLAAGAAGRRDVRDLEPTPSRAGYWIVDATGRVTAFGDAAPLGDLPAGALRRGEHAASLSATPNGRGYWIFTDLGRVFPFGDAVTFGDLAAVRLNGPVLDSVPTATGRGYYMVASDGGIFAFGDAAFHGSMGATRLNAPVRGLVPDGDGSGYWLVASDGGIFAFDAPFRGSMGATRLNKPVTGMVRYGDGYLMVGEDGGIFDFSSSPFAGSLGSHPPAVPIVSVASL